MDRGASAGINSDSLWQQLPGLAQAGDDAEIGVDGQGRLVQRTETNATVFAQYQENLKQHLLHERTTKFTRLKDHSIMAVPVPDDLTVKALKNALLVFTEAEKKPQEAIQRYFPDSLLEYTQQYNPALFRKIQTAPPDKLGELKREALLAKEEEELARAIANSSTPQPVPSQPTPSQSPAPTHKEKTRSPSASPVGVKAPKGQERLFDMVKHVMGQELTDEQIVLGIEKNVFNMVLYFTPASQQRSIEQDKERYLRNIRALLEAPVRDPGKPSARKPVDSPSSVSAEANASTPKGSQGHQPLPLDVASLTKFMLTLTFTKNWDFYNTLSYLSRLNDKTKGKLDHPELLDFIDQILEKMTGSQEYKQNPKYHDQINQVARTLPETEFRRRILQKLGQQPPVALPPSHSPSKTSPSATPVTRTEQSLAPPIKQTSPAPQPAPGDSDALKRIAQKYQLSDLQLQTVLNVFGEPLNEDEVETALNACSYLYQQGSPFPLEFLLWGMRQYPDDAMRISSYQPGNDRATNKKIAEPFLRQCVLDYAKLNNASNEAKNNLTTINLWHQPDLLNQVQAMHQMNDLHRALYGVPMKPDQMVFALADNKLTPPEISRLQPFLPAQPLVDGQGQAAGHPDIQCIARAIDGSEKQPSPKAISVCKDVARYVSGNMDEDEYLRKKADIDRAMGEVSYSWVPNYLENQELLHRFIGNTLKSVNDQKIQYLARAMTNWYHASRNGKGVEFIESLSTPVRNDLRIVFDRLAFANLQNFGRDLQTFEPFVSGAIAVHNFKEDLELSQGFMGKGRQDKVAARFRELGVKPGQRTIADGNCGFAAIGIMTGDSPMEVRARTRQAALDMQDYMDHKNLDRIKGDPAYRQRVRKAVESFAEKSWIEGLDQPGNRAKIVGLNPTETDFSRKDNPKVKGKPLAQPDLWLSDEDLQLIAVAYGRPVIPLAEVDDGNQLFGKYVSAEGELKYVFDDNFYEEGQAALKQQHPAPLTIMNLGRFAFAHWMPTEPAPLPRTRGMKGTRLAQPLNKDELLTSIRQKRDEKEQYLASLAQNPQLVPAGQNMLTRPESPKYDDIPGSNNQKQQQETLQAHRKQWLEDLERDPMMSLQVGAIGPEAEKYQHLTRMPSINHQDQPDLEQSLRALNIKQPVVEQLPPVDAGKTPGFRNFGSRTCFCNAGLKQQIAGMTMADVKALKDRAYALRRNHLGVYNHTFWNAYGEKTQVRDGGKRASLMLSFAGLAEATLKARSDQSVSDIEKHLWRLHQACYELGQSQDIEAVAFRRYYPHGPEKGYSGKQWDSHEFMVKLLEIVDEDSQLSDQLSQAYTIQTTDGSQHRKERTGTPQSIISVPIDGRSLEECLSPSTATMEQRDWVIFSDGKEHAADKTDFFVHPNPQDIRRLNIQAMAFGTNQHTGVTGKLTREARGLVLQHPFEQIKVPLVNGTSKQTESIPMQVKSIVAHTGNSVDVGHYVTFEKQGNQWYLYDDNRTMSVSLKEVMESQPGMVPYMFQYERMD